METSQIPQNFYEAEVREGCEVSEHTKRVWAREIELYFEFDRVCKKHNLTYYIAYGSLLGAVRHGGFIPWDDDLDVLMMRKDYDILCKVAPEEFKEPFFFQNEHTDKGCRLAFTKLRNSNTCGMTPFEKLHDFRYNQGMFFDIFPLDNASSDPEEQKAMIAESVKLQKQATNWSRYFDSKKLYFGRKWLYVLTPAVWAVKAVVKLFGIPNLPLQKLEKLMRKHENEQTENVVMIALDVSRVYPKSIFKDIVMLPFEFFEVPAPVGYEEFLQIQYGNWRTPVKGGTLHEGTKFDTEKSYKEYLK